MHVIYHHFSFEFVKKTLRKDDTSSFEGRADLCLKKLFSKLPNILATTLKHNNFKAFESAGGEFRIALY